MLFRFMVTNWKPIELLLPKNMHARIHTYITHTYMHTYIHAHIHTHTSLYTNSFLTTTLEIPFDRNKALFIIRNWERLSIQLWIRAWLGLYLRLHIPVWPKTPISLSLVSISGSLHHPISNFFGSKPTSLTPRSSSAAAHASHSYTSHCICIAAAVHRRFHCLQSRQENHPALPLSTITHPYQRENHQKGGLEAAHEVRRQQRVMIPSMKHFFDLPVILLAFDHPDAYFLLFYLGLACVCRTWNGFNH